MIRGCWIFIPAAQYFEPRLNAMSVDLEQLAVDLHPVKFSLNASPNPFRDRTVIRFDLPVDAKVSLKVYDVLGREVSTLVNGSRTIFGEL